MMTVTPHQPSVRAFTLIEVMVSVAILSVVIVAMSSVMMLASKALPTPEDPERIRSQANDVLEQIVTELQVANVILIATDKQISFTVPDRDGDGTVETIDYRWGGSPGDPLYRQYNYRQHKKVMPSCAGFTLSYKTADATRPGPPVTSSEVLLAGHASAQNEMDYLITDSKWTGQAFAASNLPGDALSWSVTRVRFRARHTSTESPDEVQVQVRIANADHTPSSNVLDQTILDESTLAGAYSLQTFTFSNVDKIDPAGRLCLVLKSDKDHACYIQYDNQSGNGYLNTSDAGAHWGVAPGKSLLYQVYGTYTTPGPRVPAKELRSVTMTLSPDDAPDSQARNSVVTLSRPYMP